MWTMKLWGNILEGCIPLRWCFCIWSLVTNHKIAWDKSSDPNGPLRPLLTADIYGHVPWDHYQCGLVHPQFFEWVNPFQKSHVNHWGELTHNHEPWVVSHQVPIIQIFFQTLWSNGAVAITDDTGLLGALWGSLCPSTVDRTVFLPETRSWGIPMFRDFPSNDLSDLSVNSSRRGWHNPFPQYLIPQPKIIYTWTNICIIFFVRGFDSEIPTRPHVLKFKVFEFMVFSHGKLGTNCIQLPDMVTKWAKFQQIFMWKNRSTPNHH